MATITLNDTLLDVEDGRPLLEVIKEQGIAITNLCYIDGLEPYAGCRTCLVEIEGGRPTSMQLSCTAVVADGMVVRTETPVVKQARQSVMSLILANHPDRCLTCHRGLDEPEGLDEIMLSEIDDKGVDAAVARYRECAETTRACTDIREVIVAASLAPTAAGSARAAIPASVTPRAAPAA